MLARFNFGNPSFFHQHWFWRYCFGRPQKCANLPNWTGGCARPRMRVAMEVKLLIGALRSSPEIASAPKNPQIPPRRPKWLKMTIDVKKLKKNNRMIIQGPFFGWFNSQVTDLPSSPFLVLLSKGKSSCALPFIPEADRINLFSDRFRRLSFAILTLE